MDKDFTNDQKSCFTNGTTSSKYFEVKGETRQDNFISAYYSARSNS